MKNTIKALALAAVAACALVLAACGGGADAKAAATVNGVAIPESSVTQEIQNFRTSMSLENEDDWGKWLAESSYTPESYRQQTIDELVDAEVLNQAAAAEGITVSDADVDAYIESIKGSYESDEEWQDLLESSGMTEESFRATARQSMLEDALQEKVASDDGSTKATDAQIIEYYQDNREYYDDAKRSSAIIFEEGDTSTAKDVLAQINSGALSFTDAVKQYSTDEESKNADGDMGWDVLQSQDDDYMDALAELAPGQTSGVVDTIMGPTIILCTEEFVGAEDGKATIDIFPEAILTEIRESVDMSNGYDVFDAWLEDYKSGLEIEIVEMPEGLPYYVDMAKFEEYMVDSDTTEEDLLDEEGDALYEDNADLEEMVDDGEIIDEDGNDLADIDE